MAKLKQYTAKVKKNGRIYFESYSCYSQKEFREYLKTNGLRMYRPDRYKIESIVLE